MNTLHAGLIHVWLVSPAELLCQSDELTSYLSEVERNRAAGYKVEVPRTQFVLARGFLRRTLAGYLQVPPESLSFGTTGNDKPVLLGSATVHFNLSHTANAIALAVSSDRAVGVDVEQLQPRRSIISIAQQQFHPAEQEELAAGSETERLAIFYRIWTCKEAYLKGLGLGFSQSLASFAMRPRADRYQPTPSLDGQTWSVLSEIRNSFALAIAAPGDWQVQYQHLA